MTQANTGAEDMSDMDAELKSYAGQDYAEPRMVRIEELDLFYNTPDNIDDLIRVLVDFRARHASSTVEFEFDKGGYDEYPKAEFTAYRMETPEEVAQRIESYRPEIMAKRERRLREYMALKSEFEGRS